MYLRGLFRLSFLMFFIFLTSCGGGGGDSDSLHVSQNKIDLFAEAEGASPSTQTITVNISGYDSSVYFAMFYTDYGLREATYDFVGDEVEIYLFPRSPSALTPGVYDDEITIIACKDYDCNEQISGSPYIVNVQYIVGDGIGDSKDFDEDHDGVLDTEDIFPFDSAEQLDTDGDGIGNNADTDDDNDGVSDAEDELPLDSAEQFDADNDGIGNNADMDDDNDGVADTEDEFPFDSAEQFDTDGDGIGNNADKDDDNDGVSDAEDELPLDSSEQFDADNDGIGNNADMDDDNDGVADTEDEFPFDSAEQFDTDGDGIGNNADTDDDNDGVSDADDELPLDPTETVDTDKDGMGNNTDLDDDNDNAIDEDDAFPLDFQKSVESSSITFKIKGKGQLVIDGIFIECVENCIYINDNAKSSDLNIRIYSDQHFDFVGWGNEVYCNDDAGPDCDINVGHDAELIFNIVLQEDPHFILHADMSENGGFIESLGYLQCENECEYKFYDSLGEQATLIPIANPGYIFAGWSGDCDGVGNCILSFDGGDVADISATFVKSGDEFDLCPGDNSDVITGFGDDSVGSAGRFLALCNGHVFLTEVNSNQVYVRDVINKKTTRTYQLSSKPYELALDQSNKLLYVTHGEVSFFSRVDLVTGVVVQIPFSDGAQSLTVGNQGELFVKRNSLRELILFDSKNMHIRRGYNIYGNYIYFNDATDRIITSSKNYYFDREYKTITEQGPSAGSGSGAGCDYVVVSPDGEHAARPCGAGNGSGYSIYDFYSHDPSIVLGIWETGAYPSGAAFSPSSNYALLTNRFDVQLFSTHTHGLVLEYSPSSCSYGDTRNLAVSKDSKLLFSLTNCGANGETAKVKWYAYDTR